jgi:hypothetical protein
VAALAAAGLVGGALGAGVGAAGAAGTRSSSDPAGDAGAGYDITFLTVGNDDAGRITFRVALPAVTTLPPGLGLALPLDTDLRREQETIDHLITVFGGVAVLAPVTAAGPGNAFIPQSLTTSFAPGEVTVSIHRRDLGGTRALIPVVGSFTVSPAGEPNFATDTDFAPVDAGWVYRLKLPTKLLVRSTNLSPGRPAAGASFRAAIFVRDVTFGAPGDPAAGGRVTCAFTAGGKKVTTRGSLNAAGRASCAGTVPATASGRLSGRVTYIQGGVRVARTFAAPVG